MNRILVLYRSNYGYTKAYAQMIAQELGCEARDAASFPIKGWRDYDTILYGGGLYASGICGIGLIKRNLARLEGKRLIVWATGMSPGHPEDLAKIREHNFPAAMRERIPFFYLRGGFDYQKLSLKHRLMMDALKWRLSAIKEPSEEQRLLLQAYAAPVCWCDRAHIEPLVRYVRSL